MPMTHSDSVSGLMNSSNISRHEFQYPNTEFFTYPLPKYRPKIWQVLYSEKERRKSQSQLVFWRGKTISMESQETVSVEQARSSSVSLQARAQDMNRDLTTKAQQTDVTCNPTDLSRSTTEMIEEQTMLIGESSFSNNNSTPINNNNNTVNTGQTTILSSVRALLLQKHVQAQESVKDVGDASGSAVLADTICRICFGGESVERLVRPCSCRGTVAAVHRSCLERWLLQAASSYCELCRYHYRVTRTHKWSLLRSVAEWARSGRGSALAADVWRGAALGAASALCTSRALHACDHLLHVGARGGGYTCLAANLTSSILIGLTGALNGLLTTWMLLKIQEHQASWRNWRDSTLHVHVTLIPQQTDTDMQEFIGDSQQAPVSIPSDSTVVADASSLGDCDSSLISIPRYPP